MTAIIGFIVGFILWMLMGYYKDRKETDLMFKELYKRKRERDKEFNKEFNKRLIEEMEKSGLADKLREIYKRPANDSR